MSSFMNRALSFLLSFLHIALAQITVNLIPEDASACPNGPSGTATFSTVQGYPTGSQEIPAGDFWNQAGAVWTFETDSQGILFGDLGFGVGPDGAGAADSSAIKLDPSSTAWTLSVPSGACMRKCQPWLCLLADPEQPRFQ